MHTTQFESVTTIHTQEGNIYRLCLFVATTTDERVAQKFAQSVVCEYHIPSNSKCACDLSPLSEFKDESEVLMVPFTAVRVLKITPTRIVYDVMGANYNDFGVAQETLEEVDEAAMGFSLFD